MSFPHDPGPDLAPALLRDPFGTLAGKAAELGADAFESRVAGHTVLCLHGAGAAAFFYDDDRFTRVGAMPTGVVRLLQGEDSVQSLDGEAHRRRKALFLDLLLPEDRVADLAARFDAAWREAEPGWRRRGRISLMAEVTPLLASAACGWTGTPMSALGGARLPEALEAMVANAGRLGPRNWLARFRRARVERRARRLVRRVRRGGLDLPAEAPLARIARFEDPARGPLSDEEAVNELLNLLRPIVAVNRFIAHAGLALAREPAWRGRLREDPVLLEPFVEEVRRLTPFFPLIAGRAARDLEWRGEPVTAGRWTLLDLHGTNRDPRGFPDPERLDPARAASWRDQDHRFVPQGAGEAARTHRCPGEAATVALMTVAAARLCALDWEAAPGSLELSDDVPPVPRDGLMIRLGGA
ncbi:MAG: cytochrome P450 [Albimonas sp.]|uniref:cytochrome P450 n=1 Tax=Albimonas sp. TaxID=1872425 RepID=UPI0040567062